MAFIPNAKLLIRLEKRKINLKKRAFYQSSNLPKKKTD
jgi:hypothetical protein